MIRTLLASTALATFLVGSAMAQSSIPPVPTSTSQPMVVYADSHLASSLIGEAVYNSSKDDASDIGKVVDLVIDNDGEVDAIIVGVGGFLGIGQKEVALQYDQLEWASKADGKQWLVVPTTKEALEALPVFDRSAFKPSQTGTAIVPGQPASSTTTTATGTSALQDVPMEQISADKLIGTNVYGADDKKIGDINDVVLSSDGKIDAIIVDVGGFLGINAKHVAVGMDNLTFKRDTNEKIYLYSDISKAQLEAQPAYDAATYSTNRDQMRLKLP